MGTAELQEEIKTLLKKLKWSQRRLGSEFYYAQHGCEDDDKELNRYEEKAKKDLLRTTTKVEVLQSYLNLITQHDEFMKLGLVVPVYLKNKLFSEEMELGMKKISELIGKLASE